MTDVTPDEAFRFLFMGSQDAIGTEEGGCVRLGDDMTSRLYDEAFTLHLEGDNPMGTYPLFLTPDGWRVLWGCVDFDEGDFDSWIHAQNLRNILDRMGIRAWVERSRSKGYHVWVFAAAIVSPETMRHALYHACELVKAPTKEVNPKQTSLGEGELGNYVRLPYPGREDVDGRRCFVDMDGDPIEFSEAMIKAWRDRTDRETLENLAGRYTPPPPPERTAPKSTDDGRAYDRLTPYIRKIVEEGPIDGDRSSCLYKIAQLIAEEGNHTSDECYHILKKADEQWGKYSKRRDGEMRLMEIVEKTWSKHFQAESE